VLRAILLDDEVSAALVLDDRQRVLAGEATALECLLGHLPPGLSTGGGSSGWADCGFADDWVALPVDAPGSFLLVA
jgi:hypothetical protein